MSKFCLFIALLVVTNVTSAQQLLFKWAKAFDPHNAINYGDYSNGRTVGVDQFGNVYSAGLFQRTVDFDPGPGLFTMTATNQYEEAIYITKLDADGNFVWARQIPALVEFGEVELKVDKVGNVYLVSNFTETADMDPGPGVVTVTPIGSKDAFVMKLDTNGNLVWVKQFGGPGDTVPAANVLEIDKDNNIIVCGLFNNTVDFDPGPGTFNLTSTAHLQAYIVKLSNNGDLIWAKQFGNSPVVYSGANIVDVRCDANGDIVVVGGFSGTCDFDPGTGIFNLTGKGLQDGFIAKLTTDGNLVWAKGITNTGDQYNYLVQSRAVEIDSKNNIVIAGAFIGTFDFDPGPAIHNISANPYDCYILKLTAQGDFIWVRQIGGQESDLGNDLVLDANDNVYVAGTFGGSVDLDPGAGVVLTAQNGASAIIKLTSSGNFVSASQFPTGSLFRRMDIDPALNIYVTGYVTGRADYDPGDGVYQLGGAPGQSPFVMKLGPCSNTSTFTLHVEACSQYTLNNETFDSSGTYTQIIPNSFGCDSLITLNLTITKSFSQQSQTICEPNFFFAGGANRYVSGTYTDTLQSAIGCDSIVTTFLTVKPKPLPNLGPDQSLCSNVQLNITPGAFSNYRWQDGSDANSITISSQGTYWVTVTDNFGCTATDTLKIPSIVPVPSNFLNKSDSICRYESLKLLSSNAYPSYQWSDGSTGREKIITQPGAVWLTVTDQNGCSATDTMMVFAKQCIEGFSIPTAFTPNGDGKNDDFKPLLFGKVMKYRFAIYNRWGAMIFHTTDPDKAWDGRVGSTIQSTTTFAWSCYYQLEGQAPKNEKGTVILIR
jgi:gliding motility-associated-like protein